MSKKLEKIKNDIVVFLTNNTSVFNDISSVVMSLNTIDQKTIVSEIFCFLKKLAYDLVNRGSFKDIMSMLYTLCKYNIFEEYNTKARQIIKGDNVIYCNDNLLWMFSLQTQSAISSPNTALSNQLLSKSLHKSFYSSHSPFTDIQIKEFLYFDTLRKMWYIDNGKFILNIILMYFLICSFAIDSHDIFDLKFVSRYFQTENLVNSVIGKDYSILQFVVVHTVENNLCAVKSDYRALQFCKCVMFDKSIVVGAFENCKKVFGDNDKVWTELIKIFPHTLKFVPLNEQTFEMCKIAILYNTSTFEYVRDDLKTQDMCNYIFSSAVCNIRMFKFIPQQFQTFTICLVAVFNNGNLLKDVRQDLKCREICLTAIEFCKDEILQHVPVEIQTLEMCKKACLNNAKNVYHVRADIFEQLRNFL